MSAHSLETIDFIVNRQNLRDCRFVSRKALGINDLRPGQVLVKIDKFAFTANNVTYAAFGEAMSYWKFFPTEGGWGCIPVWGFADVMASQHSDIAVGERLYGYFPMSTHLILQPDRVTANGFMDASAHRQPLPAAYNHYVRIGDDPAYAKSHENLQALFRPLFITSFLIDDFLEENNFFGARKIILTSASSKTAFGLAYLLSQHRAPKIEIIGLSSPANIPFVKDLQVYSQVLAYDQIATLPTDHPVVLVDMAGNGPTLVALHHHFSDQMKYSCRVGAAHWEEEPPSGKGLPGAKPTFFFAPDRLRKRGQDWGPGGIEERFAKAWAPFIRATENWIDIEQARGPDAVRKVYTNVLEGRSNPKDAHILAL